MRSTRVAVIGLSVFLVVCSLFVLGAAPVTDRRIDRTVSSHLAALEARVRELETVVGGGTSQEIAEDFVSAFESTSSATYVDLATIGPTVTVNVGRTGTLLVLFGANIHTVNPGARGGRVSFEVVQDGIVVQAPDFDRSTINFVAVTLDGRDVMFGKTILVTGLQPIPATITMKYVTTAAGESCSFSARTLQVAPF